jgi:hypothetical protein
VAEELHTARTVLHHLDAPGLGVDRALVDGAGDQGVDVDGLRVEERVVALQTGQLDDLLDESGQAGALCLHPSGEPGDRIRVLGRLLDRLGQQVERPDGGLQLVGDVGDEVAADRLDPPLAGAVLDQGQHQTAGQGSDARGHVHGRPVLDPVQHQLGVADLPVPSYLPDHVDQVRDGQRVTADQAQDVRRRGGLDHPVPLVDDQGA